MSLVSGHVGKRSQTWFKILNQNQLPRLLSFLYITIYNNLVIPSETLFLMIWDKLESFSSSSFWTRTIFQIWHNSVKPSCWMIVSLDTSIGLEVWELSSLTSKSFSELLEAFENQLLVISKYLLISALCFFGW